ncbi:phage tail protein [Methylomonas lenta]|uniref:Phage tail protein n=1 Tax=Methylomonas lenta TaxID=980561 RepID=A0A177NI69_9GAMM|nr:phage tail sheath subtilisin-like domain-containing protein [Methylomonas lenta]OAI16919.1 phage tail protein [Methylomonas lenta]
MPEYLAPGVYIEEKSFRARSIEGVGTSVAAIVGPTRTGPFRGKPEVVTSFAEFERIYGDLEDLQFAASITQLNYTALAARAFFDNGGKQLFVSRVVKDVNSSNPSGDGSSAVRASRISADTKLKFQSRFPGKVGNYVLELHWQDSENLFSIAATTAPVDGEELFLEASEVPKEVRVVAGDLEAGKFPLSIKARVRRNGANYDVLSGEIKDKDDVVVALTRLVIAQLPTATSKVSRIQLRTPASGKLQAGVAVELRLSAVTDLSNVSGLAHWGSLKVLKGQLKLDAGGKLSLLSIPVAQNAGVLADIDFPISALAALPGNVSALLVRRNFDLDVLRIADIDKLRKGASGEIVYRVGGLSTSAIADDSLGKKLLDKPGTRDAQLTQPIACTVANDADVFALLHALFDADALNNPHPVNGPRYLIELQNGSDGDIPESGDYAGEIHDKDGNTGLATFEQVEDISIVMTPAAAALDTAKHLAVVIEMQKHCKRMQYRVGVVDSEANMSISEIRDFKSNLDDTRLALYYPWVVTSDPTGQRDSLSLPPGGFIAGVYANTDVSRGVHKAPANEVVLGALHFEQDINRFQQELLNPNGINCLRSMPGRGHRVWGARTTSSDPEWKYVNVRRYFLFLERSIDKSTQWAVFEPNGEALWASIRISIEDFLYNEWVNGHLLGPTPKHAYFVRCDRSTMTQNDLDNGRLVCEVGVAALKPAEFVIFRIGQKTADA